MYRRDFSSAVVWLALTRAVPLLPLHAMMFDADRQEVSYQTHWQESREGSMGGFGVQGGGCGCK